MGTCEEDTCALNTDFTKEMKTCTIAPCHNAGLMTPKSCANYGGKCDMVEFKPEDDGANDDNGNGNGGTSNEAPHCANIEAAKPSCSDKCDTAACSGEPTVGDLTCAWAPADGTCKPKATEDCYSAMDKSGCDKLTGCAFEGEGEMAMCTDDCAAAETETECGKNRDCKYEATNVCQIPKCDGYKNSGDCNKHVVDSQCFWGVGRVASVGICCSDCCTFLRYAAWAASRRACTSADMVPLSVQLSRSVCDGLSEELSGLPVSK